MENKSAKLGTKIEPLPGDLNARMVRCGKANCKCAKGDLHGPYYVRRWRSGGHRSSKYVKKGTFWLLKPLLKAAENNGDNDGASSARQYRPFASSTIACAFCFQEVSYEKA